jgi:hypothetical protein
MLMSPCHVDSFLDPTSVKDRIWDDGIETSRCDTGSSRLCPMRCWKPAASIIPKSKDRFMERPPMKIVQP